MRLFIAIDFNELKDYFAKLQDLLPKNATLSFTKTFHLTLKFLGEVQPDKVETIINDLKNIKFRQFPVFLDSIGIFPSENYIRVVWIGLNPEEKIMELQQNIDESLKRLFKCQKSKISDHAQKFYKFLTKEKDFKAHITLARVKYPEDKKSFLEQLRKIKIENKKIEIKDFRLIKSTLNPKGPVYEDLYVFNFG